MGANTAVYFRRPDAPDPDPQVRLTVRQLQVLRALCEGYGADKEIADKLGIATGTVSNYISQLFSILGVNSRVELVSRAMQHGEACRCESIYCTARRLARPQEA